MKNRKIKSIKRSKRYNDRIIITFYDKSVLRLTEDAFLLHPYAINDIIKENDVSLLNKDMRIREARDAAYRLLGYRMRSIYEMKIKLKSKGFSSNEVENVINKLEDLGYLNDEQFAETLAREKISNKKVGPIFVQSELKKHNIEQAMIDKIIKNAYQEHKILELIKFHINKKIKSNSSMLQFAEKKKIDSLLYRKGFLWDDINTAYAELDLI